GGRGVSGRRPDRAAVLASCDRRGPTGTPHRARCRACRRRRAPGATKNLRFQIADFVLRACPERSEGTQSEGLQIVFVYRLLTGRQRQQQTAELLDGATGWPQAADEGAGCSSPACVYTNRLI
ncbi:MAG: hypothetical protein MUP81_00770, partial [Dehalococcoidia bacterium]|nr:hypothetical protein [Dehalococcoidia bacterium]